MARTVDYWYNEIINRVNADENLSVLQEDTSAVAPHRLWAYIIAFVIWTLDTLMDIFYALVDARLADQKAHRLTWYRNLALKFQYGQALIPDTDQYANTGLTADQIAAQKIITQAAVVEIPDGTMRMKVVKLVAGDYAELTTPEKAAFTEFIQDQKDGGVHITIDSLPPDGLKTRLDIWYNPLVLDGTGARIDGNANTPVIDGGNGYLKNLKFNGEFAKTRLTDALQLVDGVALVTLYSAQAQYGTRAFEEIDEVYIPDGGYLRVIDGGWDINYRPYNV